MTEKAEPLSGSRSMTEQFLLHRTRTAHTRTTDRVPLASCVEIRRLCPGILAGARLIEQAMVHLADSSRFGTMAIRIDDPAPGGAGKASETQMGDALVSILDRACETKRGIWGSIDDDRLGAFFPDVNDSQCLEIAESIQKDLSRIRDGTLTIGVAAYPKIGYGREHILDNAVKALDHAMFFGPDSAVVFDAVSLNVSGDGLYDRGDIYAAMDEFKRALEIDPANVNVHNSIGVCYGVEDMHDAALASFKRATQLDPADVMPLYNAGLVEMLKDNLETALTYFSRATTLEEDRFEVLLQTGRCHLRLKHFDRALPLLKKASRLKPDSGTALAVLVNATQPWR